MKKYTELVEDLKKVKDLGFVKTHRSGNTGIGKTLEDLLGIKENNIAGPNGYQTELKSARKGSSSMLTLFTKAPMPQAINGQLLEKFGRTLDDGTKQLHTTINAVERKTLYGKTGFKIEVLNSRVEIGHPNYGNMQIPYWEKQELKNALATKYPQNLLYVKADCRGNDENEEFHFNEAWLMTEFSFNNFIQLLKNGKILVDIRIGQYSDGRPHDHGTGFRVLPENRNLCFSSSKRVL